MTNEGRLSAPPLPSPAVAVPRIAIASSGLGHINRGVESWANDLAVGLHRKESRQRFFQAAGTPRSPGATRYHACGVLTGEPSGSTRLLNT